jgi:hypothetical protein
LESESERVTFAILLRKSEAQGKTSSNKTISNYRVQVTNKRVTTNLAGSVREKFFEIVRQKDSGPC